MARLSLLRKNAGTYDLGVCLALRQKLGPLGYKVKVMKLRWTEFLRVNKPCLVAVSYKFLIDHMEVVLDAGPEVVQLFDPSIGYASQPARDFRKEWRGRAVVVFRKDPFEGMNASKVLQELWPYIEMENRRWRVALRTGDAEGDEPCILEHHSLRLLDWWWRA